MLRMNDAKAKTLDIVFSVKIILLRFPKQLSVERTAQQLSNRLSMGQIGKCIQATGQAIEHSSRHE
jgi:hypothetical protein